MLKLICEKISSRIDFQEIGFNLTKDQYLFCEPQESD